MRTKYFIFVLLILLSAILLSACDVVGVSASTSLGGITPMDTSARMLLVTIGITEDQDATDGRSQITLQFRSAVVAEDNSVRFAHQEAVTCNDPGHEQREKRRIPWQRTLFGPVVVSLASH